MKFELIDRIKLLQNGIDDVLTLQKTYWYRGAACPEAVREHGKTAGGFVFALIFFVTFLYQGKK